MGVVSGLSLANQVVHALFSQDGCQRKGFWEMVGIHGVSFWPFLNSSGWWWLISSMFLIRTSCHKTTHANGYYGAWPRWASFSQCASPNNHTCFSPPHFWLKTNKSQYPYLLCDHLEGWRHTTFYKNCKAKHGIADNFSNGNSDCLFSRSCKPLIKPLKTGRKKPHNIVNSSNPLCG